MLLLNKTQEELNFTAFNAIFGLQICSKGFVNNKLIFDRKLTFIERVSQFSTGGGQDDYAHLRASVIDVVA